LQATLPEFLRRRIQKYRRPRSQQLTVILLGESPAAERNHTIAVEGVRQQIVQRIGFGGSEGWLSLEAKNFENGLPLTGLNAGIEIHKVPGQSAGKFLPNGILAGPHEPYEKHSTNSHGNGDT
jgi:hypothetical protein